MSTRIEAESPEVLKAKIEAFNEMHSVGSKVLVVRDDGRITRTTVKHPATILGEHTAVAWLDKIVGCYDLSRVF